MRWGAAYGQVGVILAAHLNGLLQGLVVGGFRSCVMEHRERRSVADRCAG